MNKVYCALDDLLDTRLGVIHKLNPEAVDYIIQHDRYHGRDFDDWERLTGGLITNEQFTIAWDKRDLSLITEGHCVRSGLFLVINKLLADHYKNILNGVSPEPITLEVNLYPYECGMEEVDILRGVMGDLFSKELDVHFISIPIEKVTLEFIKERYAALIFYDFQKWWNVNVGNIPKYKLNEVNLIVPRIFSKDPSGLTEEEKNVDITKLKLLSIEFIDIEFIDAKWFSMYRPDLSAQSEEDEIEDKPFDPYDDLPPLAE